MNSYVKCRSPFSVIPAKAGIHLYFKHALDSGFRRSDGSSAHRQIPAPVN